MLPGITFYCCTSIYFHAFMVTLKIASIDPLKHHTRILYSQISFSEKIRLDILYELSAQQTVHMKYQALFSWYTTIRT